jgi:hypothetical protein
MNKPLTARAIFLCFLFTNIESIFYDCFRSVSTPTGSVLIEYLVELCKSQALPICDTRQKYPLRYHFRASGCAYCLAITSFVSISTWFSGILVSRSVTILHTGNQWIPEESQVEKLSFQEQAAVWPLNR